MNHQEPYYTRKVVAEKLGISESTVYKYVKDGKIRAVPNPNKMRSQVVYFATEVDELAEVRAALQIDDNALSIAQVAAQYGLKKQQISYILSSHELEVNRIKLDNRTKITIPPATVSQIIRIHEQMNQNDKYLRKQYYNEALDMFLYQLFTDEQENLYRVATQDGEWGFKSKSLGFISMSQLENEPTIQLKPVYSIHSNLPFKASSYLKFSFRNTDYEYSYFVHILDYFLSVVGCDAVKLEVTDDNFNLSIAQVIIDIQQQPLPKNIGINELNHYVLEGDISVVGTELFIIGNTQSITFEIERSLYNSLQLNAEKSGKKPSDILNAILKKHYT